MCPPSGRETGGGGGGGGGSSSNDMHPSESLSSTEAVHPHSLRKRYSMASLSRYNELLSSSSIGVGVATGGTTSPLTSGPIVDLAEEDWQLSCNDEDNTQLREDFYYEQVCFFLQRHFLYFIYSFFINFHFRLQVSVWHCLFSVCIQINQNVLMLFYQFVVNWLRIYVMEVMDN